MLDNLITTENLLIVVCAILIVFFIMFVVLFSKIKSLSRQCMFLQDAIENSTDMIEEIQTSYKTSIVPKQIIENSQKLDSIKDDILNSMKDQLSIHKTLAYMCEPRIVIQDSVVSIKFLFVALENMGNGIAYNVTINDGNKILYADDYVSIVFDELIVNRTLNQKERLLIKLSINKEQDFKTIGDLRFFITWKDYLDNNYISQYSGKLDSLICKLSFTKVDFSDYSVNE